MDPAGRPAPRAGYAVSRSRGASGIVVLTGPPEVGADLPGCIAPSPRPLPGPRPRNRPGAPHAHRTVPARDTTDPNPPAPHGVAPAGRTPARDRRGLEDAR